MNEETRQNPLCVISTGTYGENEMHDIQTNTAWEKNPYGNGYAVVPDEMVKDIRATRGYCDIKLNKGGTEVVSFTAREIPEPKPIPEQKKKVTAEDILNALTGGKN